MATLRRVAFAAALILGSVLRFGVSLECGATSKTSYITTDDARLPESVLSLHRNVSTVSECRRRCTDNGACASVVYWRGIRECELHSLAARNGNELTLQPDVEYLEKVCLDATEAVCAISFDRVPQGVLYGFAGDVLEPVTLAACLSGCQKAGAQCKSVMYFFAERQCVFNSVTATERPDLFDTVAVDEFLVDYFERRCGSENAEWLEWTAWSTCTNGRRGRTRGCSVEGACTGGDEEECQDCAMPTWLAWGGWSACTGGRRNRQRACTVTGACTGTEVETEPCTMPTWLAWGAWSTCVDGQRKRQRQCAVNGACTGDETGCEACAMPTWYAWGAWSACAGGQRKRQRQCSVAGACAGDKTQCEACTMPTWQAWGAWSSCTNGQRKRHRQCTVDGACLGSVTECEVCSAPPTWHAWGAWSACKNGGRRRVRVCPQPGRCTGQETECQDCARPPTTRGGYYQSRACMDFREMGYASYSDCLRRRTTPARTGYYPPTTATRRGYYPEATTTAASGYVSRRCVNFIGLGYGSYSQCVRNST